MNLEQLEIARDALIKALDSINSLLGSNATQKLGMRSWIIRLPEVTQLTGLSRSTIYNGIKDGTFPKPVSLGARAVGWHQHSIDVWIQGRGLNE